MNEYCPASLLRRAVQRHCGPTEDVASLTRSRATTPRRVSYLAFGSMDDGRPEGASLDRSPRHRAQAPTPRRVTVARSGLNGRVPED